MTYQVKLDNYKSYDDLGLKVLSDNLSRAISRQVYQTINGMDGSYNMTNVVHGRVTYEPRTLTVIFQSFAKTEQLYDELCSNLDSLFSGQSLKIIRDCDTEHYLTGEATFESEQSFCTQQHTLTVVCYPFRFNLDETEETFEIDNEDEITLTNEKMPVQPVFSTQDSGMLVVFGTKEYNIVDELSSREIYLLEGQTTLTIKGTGTVAITYRQGVL
ncbi:MAG: hypothetical protein R3Y33_04480 [Clostridia bacterium]